MLKPDSSQFFMTASPLPRKARRRWGFSLVEVLLSVGMVSFALMALLGTLPVGLQAVQDSRMQAAKANITQNLRGMLQQLSFGTPTSNGVTISNLESQKVYYTADGMETDISGEPYYIAEFKVSDATVGDGQASSTTFAPSNAQIVQVTLTFPQGIPAEQQKKFTFSLFSAKQGAN